MRVLKKVKEKLKKIIPSRLTSLRSLKSRKKKAPVKKTRRAIAHKEIPSFQETIAVNTKFSHPETARSWNAMPQDLPSCYDQDKIVLQVRDPRWLHTYWEIRNNTLEELKGRLGEEFYRAKKILRVYDVTNIIFNGSNANSFFDIQYNDFATSWYIDTAGPGRSWCVDLGLMLTDGRFITILRSNVVQTPLDCPSWITDEEWMIPDDIFARLYGMGFGLGRSSPVGGAWQERVKQGLFSSGISSSPVKKEAKPRSFWLKVDCELIVYGATEPDAKVTVQGQPVNLRPDGTFTLRYYLPDSRQVIPVRAVSGDKIEERVITPIVTRETR
ncbi:MAG: DUF4912 domain-containing protein [Candidatus Omnitrophica bacterium]|nr:DUF4912 domain-containing protein [Candidatus Omnitrophota bacterium]MDD5042138.1 DUF4912 domain-containing protein [Candidatus Omnitrophota bacterium]MDD5500167.1 DUF4912 domain-containing protein [Candidatus Omnitrophota bacterium]